MGFLTFSELPGAVALAEAGRAPVPVSQCGRMRAREPAMLKKISPI
jgi:hypothetical protein